MPRMKEIARQLGVSPSTVSLVLNNKPGVSDATRARILASLKESGYNVDGMLRGGISLLRLIIYKKRGLVVSDTPFFSELIEGIHQEARKCGSDLAITYLSDTEMKQKNAELPGQTPGEGIILLATEMDRQDLRPFIAGKCRLVVLDSRFPEESVDTVVIDNFQGACAAAEYLIRCGHRHIGYLGGSLRIHNFDERAQGFREALRQAGLPAEEAYTVSVEPTPEGAYRDCSRLFRGPAGLPSAFFADNDIIAAGAVKALREAGVRVPEDVSVIGFDDMPFCTVTDPALTTMRVFKKKMGVMAVRRLLEAARDGDGVSCRIAIDTELIVRDSVSIREDASGDPDNMKGRTI